MATWAGAIVETKGNPAFWDIARRYGLTPSGSGEVAPYVLLVCDSGPFGQTLPSFAEPLSRELGGTVVGLFAQTSADVYELEGWEDGVRVRRLAYTRDGGGWVVTEGAVQGWEQAFFFAPDLLHDPLSEADRARHEAAAAAGDPSDVLDLLHPGSIAPLERICRSFGVEPGVPAGSWRSPRSPWPWLIGGPVVLFWVGMAVLGWVSG